MSKYRKYKWRIVADNNVEREIIDNLRQKDFDVLWVAESPDLRNRDDDFHYQNARQVQRYLLTRDLDFWDDQKYPLKESPGVIIMTTSDMDVAKWLVLLLRKLIREFTHPESIYLDGVKIRLGAEAVQFKMVDHDTQRPATSTWQWRELF
jgi:predicted nuclease of predicted toxin-antitoxin system